MRAPGRVYLVGAGPGDPELITVKGLACLRRADVVVYDRLIHPALLAEAPAHAERIYAGKAPRAEACEQEWIQQVLLDQARSGRTVVRLKGGDPFVFGRGGEELAACRAAGVPCEVIPGLTSAVAVPGAAGIPLTHRGLARSFGVITAHHPNEVAAMDWAALARLDTLVVMMGVETLPLVTTRLLAAGLPFDRPGALIERGTWEEERVVEGCLGNLAARAADARIRPPAIVILGEVARLRATREQAYPNWLQALEEPTLAEPARRYEIEP